MPQKPLTKYMESLWKSIPLIYPLYRKIRYGKYDFIINAFPAFTPFSGGSAKDRAGLTVQAINQFFPFLQNFVEHVHHTKVEVLNIESAPLHIGAASDLAGLKKLLDYYGSDKANRHNYHHLYGSILADNQKVEHILEIGLGTNNTDTVSTMGNQGKPGASVRAFRDFCPNATVFGADVDKRILFSDDRIHTFFVDQTVPESFDDLLNVMPKSFDLVIDDGLHAPNANIASLDFGLKLVKPGGWVVIEDISSDALPVWHVVSSLLSGQYRSFIFSAKHSFVFAVQKA